jgi:hypothetical protein
MDVSQLAHNPVRVQEPEHLPQHHMCFGTAMSRSTCVQYSVRGFGTVDVSKHSYATKQNACVDDPRVSISTFFVSGLTLASYCGDELASTTNACVRSSCLGIARRQPTHRILTTVLIAPFRSAFTCCSIYAYVPDSMGALCVALRAQQNDNWPSTTDYCLDVNTAVSCSIPPRSLLLFLLTGSTNASHRPDHRFIDGLR